MKLTRTKALMLGIGSIVGVALLEIFNCIACYKLSLNEAFATFDLVAIPMVPAVVALFLPNPLRAVGASAFFAPWLLLAFFVDCVLPYQGGGASMIYVSVVLFGTPSAILGALLAGPVFRKMNVIVN